MIIVGIDPDLNGGIVAIDENRQCIMSGKMPLECDIKGEFINVEEINETLKSLKPDLVVLERVTPTPNVFRKGKRCGPDGVVKEITGGGGSRTAFKQGGIFYALRTLLRLAKYPHEIIRPQSWKANILTGTNRDKDAAIEYVRRTMPGVVLIPRRCHKPQPGIADAACLADFGRRLLHGRSDATIEGPR